MKLLVLGNSNDTGSWVDEGDRRTARLGKQLAEEFDIPVEVVVKNCWPNDRMAGYVSGEQDEVEPDMVFLNITTFPFAYESTPMRVKRILRRVGGEPVGDAGMRLASSKRWAHNAVFRTLRRLGKATVGGDTHFTPEEVVQRYGDVVRLLARREGMAISVKGPLGRGRPGITRRERERHEARRQRVHVPLRDLCRQLHVHYTGSDEPYWRVKPKPRGLTVGDGTHANVAGHQYLADDHYGPLREAWAAHVAEIPAG
jgi:hypothetical protein